MPENKYNLTEIHEEIQISNVKIQELIIRCKKKNN